VPLWLEPVRDEKKMIDIEKLQAVRQRLDKLNELLSTPEVAANPAQMARLGPEHRELSDLVLLIDRYEGLIDTQKDLREMVAEEDDEELVEMAKDELREVYERQTDIEKRLRLKLIPRDPEDAKDAIMEIRAGTGGQEAALFAADLFRMYHRFSEDRRWKCGIMSTSEGGVGGYKEIVFSISGEGVYGLLKYESGVHRVQRVPETESSGRLHTSAASVAVLPEVDDVEVEIDPGDLKVNVYRSSGPGGQSVNTTDSAVRITHIPSGLVVTCQDEKSQHKNKSKALRVLRSRLYEIKMEEAQAARDVVRRSAVSSGDRSVKIRTYNFPQDRVTDHRLDGKVKNYPLHKVIDGDLKTLIDALRTLDNAERLAEL